MIELQLNTYNLDLASSFQCVLCFMAIMWDHVLVHLCDLSLSTDHLYVYVCVWGDKLFPKTLYTQRHPLCSLLSHQCHSEIATIYIKSNCIKMQMIQMIMPHFYLYLTQWSIKLPVLHVPHAKQRWQSSHSSYKEACLLWRV